MTDGTHPAFALSKERAEQFTNDPEYATGLSKREYFAAMAMQGILSDSSGSGKIDTIAESSVIMADALCRRPQQES